ncbi:MAG: hypothetical protein K8S54_09410 [Spirochaetia bacterium]|nr:hypothetical protein [Spirochaetia bacterium]
MKFTDIFRRVEGRVRQARDRMTERSREAGDRMKSVIDSFSDEWMESAFRRYREMQAPSPDQMPVDFRLRESSLPRRIYEKMYPVSHVLRLNWKHNQPFLEDFMPISPEAYTGRGSYKFVYSLPWRMVLKISKEILPSDPIIGSTFRQVAANKEQFLSEEELQLLEHLAAGKRGSRRERLDFKFYRLGMERFHYWKVREALPDLVLPTRFFMGIRYRKKFLTGDHSEKITPMDSQIMLLGRHLKEFARAVRPSDQSNLARALSPRYDFTFDGERFGRIKKKILLKITDDFRRLIRFTQDLAVREKLIYDIHTENIIITLPEFELKIFDFHFFDQHLYTGAADFDRPEREHIEVIEKFIESLSQSNGD